MTTTATIATTIPAPLYSSPLLTREGRQLPSWGREVCRWIEQAVRLGRGDYYGLPFRLTSFQRRWIYRVFEYYPETELFRYKRALFGTGKGNGKTPFEGALGAEGLAGPTAPSAPLVLVGAASLDQSNLVFGDMKDGITHDDSPLKPYVTPLELSVQLRDAPGEVKRVAAVAGSNDGPRATRFLADELHEWTGRLAHVFDVLDGAIGKRENAFTVCISTAGTDKNSLLGKMYAKGKQVASGELVQDDFLFEWYEVPESVEIPERIRTDADLEQWRRAILCANPALAEAEFLSESYVRSRFDGAQAIERYKWLRYHANRFTRAEIRWLPEGRWADCRRPGATPPPATSEVVVAFSGTYDRDSAALVGIAPDGLVWSIKSWERGPDDPPDYTVPVGEVRKAVAETMERYRVNRLVCNPNGWHSEVETWAEAYGSDVVTTFDWAHQNRRKSDACSRFFTAVIAKDIGHGGEPAIERHLDSAEVSETEDGAWITASGRSGPPIDLAVATIMALDGLVTAPRRRSRKVW